MQFFQIKYKWLLLGIYKPPKQENSAFLETKNIIKQLRIIIGDFNMTSTKWFHVITRYVPPYQ